MRIVIGRTRLPSKGQVVIPQRICNVLHIKPGDDHAIHCKEDHIISHPLTPRPLISEAR